MGGLAHTENAGAQIVAKDGRRRKMTEAEKAYQYFVIAVPENEEQAKAYFWARKALQSTLTQPNEGAKDKNVPTNGPLTLEELRLMVEPTPVWWDWVQGWVLARKGMIISWNGVYYNYGEVKGNFYRRPPEGEEETP